MQAQGMAVNTKALVLQVKPTPPPVMSPPENVSTPTRAQRLRSAANLAAMQRHAGLHTAQTAWGGSPSKHVQHKPIRRKPAAHAAVIQQQPNLLVEHNELASNHSHNVAAFADAAVSDAGDASGEPAEAMHAAIRSAHTSSALASGLSAALYGECSRSCCCVPDRLIAIHVRSELTDSHFDM